MVWFTKARMVWTSKDNPTITPEVSLVEGKCFWKVTEEGQRPVGGEASGPVDAMNAAASYINNEVEKRKETSYLDAFNAKTELTKKICEMQVPQ